MLNRIAYAIPIAAGVVLILAGFPIPDGDDLFWIGPAIGLMRNGDLVNPYTMPWISYFGTDRFFVHGPVYFYAIGGWIGAFGLSAKSILVFHWICVAFAASGFVYLFRRSGVPREIAALGSLALIFILARTIRPDGLALALAFSGVAFLLSHKPVLPVIGTFALVMSMFTYPVFVPYLGLAVMILAKSKLRHWKMFLIQSLAGLILAGLTFFFMVEGRVFEFFSVFLRHRDLRAADLDAAPLVSFRLATHYSEWLTTAPFYVLFIIALLLVRRARSGSTQHLLIATAVAVTVSVFLYAESAPNICKPIAFLAGATWLHAQTGATGRRWLVAGFLCWILFSNVFLIVGILGQKPVDKSEISQIAQRLATTHGPLKIDGAVARFVFDYSIPMNGASLLYGVEPPDGVEEPPAVPNASWCKSGDVWAASLGTLDGIPGLPPEFYQVEPVRFLGITFGSVPRYPFRLTIYTRGQ